MKNSSTNGKVGPLKGVVSLVFGCTVLTAVFSGVRGCDKYIWRVAASYSGKDVVEQEHKKRLLAPEANINELDLWRSVRIQKLDELSLGLQNELSSRQFSRVRLSINEKNPNGITFFYSDFSRNDNAFVTSVGIDVPIQDAVKKISFLVEKAEQNRSDLGPKKSQGIYSLSESGDVIFTSTDAVEQPSPQPN